MFRIPSLIVWAFLILSPATSMAQDFVYDKIIVKINDAIITQYELEEEMKPLYAQLPKRGLTSEEEAQVASLKKKILTRMINDVLLAQEIEKYGIKVSDEEIDKEIIRVKQERGLNDKEFEATLVKDGLSMARFRQKLRDILLKQELIGYMVHRKVLVTDSELEAEYQSRHDEYALEKMVSLAIIVLPYDVSVQEVKKRIEDGELTFAEAAAKYSIGPAKDEGGVIGDVDWNDLADDWKAALKGVPEGDFSMPVIVKGNNALLSPIKIYKERMIPLQDVRESLFKELTQKKRQKLFKEYFEKLKQSSVIEYLN